MPTLSSTSTDYEGFVLTLKNNIWASTPVTKNDQVSCLISKDTFKNFCFF